MTQKNVASERVDGLLKSLCRLAYLTDPAGYSVDGAGQIKISPEYIGCNRMANGLCAHPDKMQDCVLPHVRWIYG